MPLPLLLNALIVVVLLVTSAHAAENNMPRSDTSISDYSARHALSPAQINAIRAMGRNVLAAKKTADKDNDDAIEELSRLRASLDQFIAVNIDPQNRSPITVQGQEESAEELHSRETISGQRKAAHSKALELTGQFREHAALLSSQKQKKTEKNDTSAGFPLGSQRALIFERLAQKLETALDKDNPDQFGQLRQLQDQLRSTQGGLSEAPLNHGTPTLQSMPAGFVPPENTDSVTKE